MFDCCPKTSKIFNLTMQEKTYIQPPTQMYRQKSLHIWDRREYIQLHWPPPPPLTKAIKSIRVAYNSSRDKGPRNFLYSDALSVKLVWSFCTSAKLSSMTNDQEIQPSLSFGSTFATRPSVSPCSSSNDKHKKSRFAFIPTIRASWYSQLIIWLATCKISIEVVSMHEYV